MSKIASASTLYGESMKTRKRKRKYWVRDYFRKRDQYGAYKLTLEELRLNYLFSFRRCLRMNTHVYDVHVFLLFSNSRVPYVSSCTDTFKGFCTKYVLNMLTAYVLK